VRRKKWCNYTLSEAGNFTSGFSLAALNYDIGMGHKCPLNPTTKPKRQGQLEAGLVVEA
jgi:hypothetical protein